MLTPDHPYAATDCYGDHYLDLEAFGRALGAEIGFPVNVHEPGRYPVVEIDCGENLSLSLFAAKAGRVKIYAKIGNAQCLDPHQRAGWPSATVDSARDIAAIARDVTRRVIAPGREAAARVAQLVAERQATTSGLADLCKELMRDFPKLQATRNSDNDTTAALDFNDGGNGDRLIGTLYPDGRISIGRLSVSNAAKARKLFALLSEED